MVGNPCKKTLVALLQGEMWDSKGRQRGFTKSSAMTENRILKNPVANKSK